MFQILGFIVLATMAALMLLLMFTGVGAALKCFFENEQPGDKISVLRRIYNTLFAP